MRVDRITLAAARVNAGLKHKEVADRIGVVFQTIGSWERGKTMPTAEQAQTLARLYNIPVEHISFAKK